MATLKSPRLETLAAQLGKGDAAALERFWREASETGTPLVEKLDGDDDHLLVTVVYRDAEAERVLVYGDIAALEPALQRLDGTDLWHATYRVSADVRTIYSLAVDAESFPAATSTSGGGRSSQTGWWPCSAASPRLSLRCRSTSTSA